MLGCVPGYVKPHERYGAEPHDGVRVFHQLSYNLDALGSLTLQFLQGAFCGLGRQAPNLIAEVFVLQPSVEGRLADAGFDGLSPTA